MSSWIERFRSSRGLVEAAGLALLVFALVALLALVSYDSGDPTWFRATHGGTEGATQNWIGPFGALIAEALFQLFGAAAFVVPVLLGKVGWYGLRRRDDDGPGYARPIGYVVLGLALCGLLDLLFGWVGYGGEAFRAGGLFGQQVAGVLRAPFNTVGAVLIAATLVATLVILLTGLSFMRTVELAGHGAMAGARGVGRLVPLAAGALAGWRANRTAGEEPIAAPAEARAPTPTRSSIRLDSPPATRPRAQPTPRIAAPAKPTPSASPRKIQPSAAPVQRSLPLERGRRGYALPSTDLLNNPEPQMIEGEQELLERARHITGKLEEFAVNGTVVAIHPGPVVTTFEFKPEAGVKYSKITGMLDDLSLALKAESVRIDRMPGRATVGIEVPNRRQETIYPKQLFEAERFRNSSSKLSLALGKDISGDVFVTELEKMPHLLIAGATGSGKSVGLNCMIVSLLYKATPAEVRMIMIDTKMIELGVYADIPHLLIPVVTDPKHASTALKWACREMEQRYRKLAHVGARNIAQFNERLAEEPDRTMPDPKTGEDVQLRPLPNIVIVIDELADLMMVSSADVEESIMRLAQMARAVGIHPIIATQRPSVDVITGTIKANFPSRIAFRVSQRVDSRTIIDQQGAEHLLGRGDMLFLSSGRSSRKPATTSRVGAPRPSGTRCTCAPSRRCCRTASARSR